MQYTEKYDSLFLILSFLEKDVTTLLIFVSPENVFTGYGHGLNCSY